MSPYWARHRDYDWQGDMVLHNDWVVEDLQFGYVKSRVTKNTRYHLRVRRKKGRFGVSSWYLIDIFDDFESLCRRLNGILENPKVQDTHVWMDRVDVTEEVKRRKNLLDKYCGHDPKQCISRIGPE